MRYDDYETLKITRSGKILTVALNRPELRNATNAQMHRELVRLFPQISQDPETNVVILTGEGKSFSAGGDIGQMQYDLDHPERWREAMAEARPPSQHPEHHYQYDPAKAHSYAASRCPGM